MDPTRLEPIRPDQDRHREPGRENEHAREQARTRRMAAELPMGTGPAAIRRRIEMMEQVLERSFVVPGINRPIGLDSIIGLVPVLGDIVTAGMGAYIVWEARNLGLPKWKIWRMAGNVAFDSAVGAVPVLGDAFDFVFRSNTRNLRIIKKHLDKHHPETRIIEG